MDKITERERQFIAEAIKLATENVISGNGGPFGAIIVKDDKIIARCGNSVTTSNDPTAHAEVNTIREACKNLNTFELRDCEIFVNAEPCPMCLSAIYWARIKKVYYAASREIEKEAGFDDSYIYEQLDKPIEKRDIPVIKVIDPNDKDPFEKWNNMENKIEY